MNKSKKNKENLTTPALQALIKNSLNSTLFRNFYVNINGQKVDVMDNGRLSCAFYVSTLLVMVGLIKKVHGTVFELIKDLDRSEWDKIKTPQIGSILVWEEIIDKKKEKHLHIGFYIGNKKAVSNNSKKGCPQIHHFTYGTKNNKPVRKISAIYNY